jgi:hypothetical protein
MKRKDLIQELLKYGTDETEVEVTDADEGYFYGGDFIISLCDNDTIEIWARKKGGE